MGELSWMAAFAAYKGGNLAQAVLWTRLSIAHGMYEGIGNQMLRTGFRNLIALYEGPYDILRFALLKLGDKTGAQQALTKYLQAKARRLDGKV